MDLGLTERVYIVTGGAGGLGRATAEVLVAEGAKVVLSGRHRESLDEAVRRDVEAQPLEAAARPLLHRPAVDPARPHRIAADENILGDRELGEQFQLLMDHADPLVHRGTGIGGRIGCSEPGHFTGGWLHAKLLSVVFLIGYHHLAMHTRKRFARGDFYLSEKACRMINEVPTLLLIAIVILVVLKPF